MDNKIETAKEWYCEKDGRQVGPMSEDEIKEELVKGDLSYKDMVWKNHVSNQVKLVNSDLKHLLKDPCIPFRKVNDIFVIIIGLLPILVFAVEVILMTNRPHQVLLEESMLMIVSAVDILLIITFFDLLQLKNKGYNIKSLHMWFWLPPVYLYIRAKSIVKGKIDFRIPIVLYGFLYLFLWRILYQL